MPDLVDELSAEVERLVAALDAARQEARRERHAMANEWNARLMEAAARAYAAEAEARGLREEVERLRGMVAAGEKDGDGVAIP